MDKDNVTPISPTVAARMPGPGRADLLKAKLDDVAERVAKQRGRIFQAMGVISCAAAAAPDSVEENDPDIRYALKAAYSLLDSVCAELDPSVLESEEVQP